MKPIKFFKTKLDALDVLLGGSGLPSNSIVLIKGEPGTGKTTLAWEIVRRVFFRGPEELPGGMPFSRVGFVSFDEETQESARRYIQSYPDCSPTREFYELISEAWGRDRTLLAEEGGLILATEASERTEGGNAYDISWDEGSPDKYFQSLVTMFDKCGLCVIDGLSALLDRAIAKFAPGPLPASNETLNPPVAKRFGARELFATLKNQLRPLVRQRGNLRPEDRTPSLVEPAIVILTSEDGHDEYTPWFDSYLADVVIHLRRERVAQTRQMAELNENILVCEVTKGRSLNIQRRSICYEFRSVDAASAGRFFIRKETPYDPDYGLAFYETYPAEGLLLLFHENEPQVSFIESFRKLDVPHFYPRLTVRTFDRTNMFHQYSIRRCAKDIPFRKTMKVFNVDEYWIPTLRRDDILERIDAGELRPYGRTYGQILDCFTGKNWLDADRGEWYAVPHFANVGMFAFRTDLSEIVRGLNLREWEYPRTWEFVEELCREIKDAKILEYPLLLEMKTIDSFVATLLELMWGHNGKWKTVAKDPDNRPDRGPVTVEYESTASKKGIIQALERLRRWVHDLKIVRRYSTIDPRHRTFSQPDGRQNAKQWAFARHWYSTLVDLLTASYADGTRLFSGKHSDIGVGPLPIAGELMRKDSEASGSSVSGEWYLAVEHGTENKQLAIAVINDLISSTRVINRAVTGAGLPVVRDFYGEYDTATCFGTNRTYEWIRRRLFAGAISRSRFVEYRFVMQRLYSCARRILDNPGADCEAIWVDTVRLIEDEEAFSGN